MKLALKAIWQVLMGEMHLVGYIQASPSGLPSLKPSVLNMLHRLEKPFDSSNLNLHKLDQIYARSWSWELDVEILWKGWRGI